jgi:hypothetical protein
MNNQHKNNQINHTGFTAYNKVKYGLKSFFLTRRSSSFTAYVKGKEYDASTSSQIRSSGFTACVKGKEYDATVNNQNTTYASLSCGNKNYNGCACE